jgi:drug/metabolite transporter (DMT)-like permease
VGQCYALFYFNDHPEAIDTQIWLKGAVGSFCNVLGYTFIHLAIDTGKDIELIFSWNLSQTVIVMIAAAVIGRAMPDWLQLIAFAIGLLGALSLIMPDLVERIWVTITGKTQEEEEVIEMELENKSEGSL